jgi:putative N6-adenine-specific DNA methylase
VTVLSFFATCARGVEEVLAAELRGLGLAEVEPGRGGVSFRGSMADAGRANLCLRTAHHVLLRLASFTAPDSQALYEESRRLAWADHLTQTMTFAVDSTRTLPAPGLPPGITHTHFAALKVKDAIADALRERRGARPSVDTRDPDLRIRLHLEGETATLFLDTSGESLHRRGYRPRHAEAPLKETLAAAVVLLSGWDGATPLCDPLCGSGTLVVEAALLARRLAPGRGRHFGFERWPGFDAQAWKRLRAAVESEARPARAPIAGSDCDPRALDLARQSARAAGVEDDVSFARRQLAEARAPAPPPGVLVCNPPYGERLGEAARLAGLYRTLGEVLKHRFAGYTAFVLAGNLDLAKEIGLAPSRRMVLMNGPIECRLLRYEMYQGSRREPPPPGRLHEPTHS